jgi:hypothetical protein
MFEAVPRGRASAWLVLVAAVVFVAGLAALALFLFAEGPRVGELSAARASQSVAANEPAPLAPAATTRANQHEALPPPIEGDDGSVERSSDFGKSLTVRVVDESGAPVANAPVGFGEVGRLSVAEGDGTCLRTDAHGLATFHDVEIVATNSRFGARFVLYLRFPELHASIVPIDPHAPPEKPVELVMHATGHLVVEVVDEDGHAVAPHGDLNLLAREAGSTMAFGAFGSEGIRSWVDESGVVQVGGGRVAEILTIGADGRAVAEFVGLGLEFEAEAVLDEYPRAKASGPGPRATGDTAKLTVQLARRGPVFHARVRERRDGRVEPVAKRALRVQFVATEDEPLPPHYINDLERAPAGPATDGAGELVFDASKFFAKIRDSARFARLIDANANEGTRAFASRSLPPECFGDVDLGEVLLEACPRLVAGHVADDAGAPVAGAEIWVEPRPAAGSLQPQRAGTIVALGRSDDAGAFVIRGLSRDATLAVSARGSASKRSGIVPIAPAVAFAPGAQNVTLVEHGCGRVAGRILVDDDFPRMHLAVFLRRGESGGGAPYESRTAPGLDGEFDFNQVPAGTFEVDVALGRYSQRPHVLATVGDVELRGGVVSRDRRLDPLDLRGRLPRAHVEVVDDTGAAVTNGVVGVDTTDEIELLTALIDRGAADPPVPNERYDLEVRVPGFDILRVRNATSPVKVKLVRTK